MINDGSGVIQIFVPGLPDTPGWVELPYKKQQALVERTSRIQQNRQLQLYGEFGELMELYEVEQLLEGEQMKMRDYLNKVYPDKNYRTISRKQKWFKEFSAIVPPGVLKRMGAVIAKHHDRFEYITKAALGDIRNAAKEVPQLPATTEKDVETYVENLETKLLEHRQRKHKGKPLKQDEMMAAKMATNALIHYMRAALPEGTSAELRRWLTKVIGWAMEGRAVSGALKNIHRTPIPDGILIRRGRPKGSGKKQSKDGAWGNGNPPSSIRSPDAAAEGGSSGRMSARRIRTG